MEEEDEFVDAVERPEEDELSDNKEEIQDLNGNAGGFEDDDFGDFAEEVLDEDDNEIDEYDPEEEETHRREAQIAQPTTLEQPQNDPGTEPIVSLFVY